MIKNPFAQAAQGEANLKRNAYDLSFQNLFSTHFGRLTPAMMQEVLPGDSFEIDSSLAIQGMPTVFPLQTRVRVSVEYYYCRNRCVMDDFEDFIFKTKDVEQCWLKMNNPRAKKMISTGSLGDFFGLPTTYGNLINEPINLSLSTSYTFGFNNLPDFTSPRTLSDISSFLLLLTNSKLSDAAGLTNNANTYFKGYYSDVLTYHINTNVITASVRTTSSTATTCPNAFVFAVDSEGHYIPESSAYSITLDCIIDSDSNANLTYTLPQDFVDFCNSKIDNGQGIILCFGTFNNVLSDGKYYVSNNVPYFKVPADSSSFVPQSISVPVYLSELLDSTDDSIIANNPFVGNTPDLKVNALPYRHYTQVCNYYHRNDKNNPYMLNGEAQYNEFIPTHATGADENVYDFCYRNWELDRFTSAVQSPQFGEAPLVGLTFSGSDTAKLTFQDADDPNQTYTATLGVEDDRITDIADFSKDIPSANLRKLQEMISYGISINDLRVTNSFQRFLENVLRRGLRYRSQLKSHFGVSVDYPDIDIPQYIGGYSGELTVGKVTSTAETSEAGLGDFNGSLSGQISSQHKIRCYCPEHGYIMCLVSLTPIPVYGQVCAKNMIKTDPFDYFLPEFGKIGFVPMHYSEVMPLQTGAGQSVNDVFGYQKAWYDYMMNYDQVHSYFRTNMKDFVLQRNFSERPELVKDFTVINPEQLSDVFVTGNISDKYDVNDKFLCNFYTHMISKRCIPRVGTPSLE